jgi:hypothetical protein
LQKMCSILSLRDGTKAELTPETLDKRRQSVYLI